MCTNDTPWECLATKELDLFWPPGMSTEKPNLRTEHLEYKFCNDGTLNLLHLRYRYHDKDGQLTETTDYLPLAVSNEAKHIICQNPFPDGNHYIVVDGHVYQIHKEPRVIELVCVLEEVDHRKDDTDIALFGFRDSTNRCNLFIIADSSQLLKYSGQPDLVAIPILADPVRLKDVIEIYPGLNPHHLFILRGPVEGVIRLEFLNMDDRERPLVISNLV